MGSHSNYLTIDSDFITAIVAIGILLIIFVALKVWKHIEENKAEKVAWEEWHKQKEEEAKLKAEMNFFENRIAEDILKSSSKINSHLVNLYKEEA